MVSVEDAVIARITKNGKHFEILVDPDKALEMRRGSGIGIENVIAVRGIFRDAGKGDKVPEDEAPDSCHRQT